MREIKFRAWDKIENKFIDDKFLVINQGKPLCLKMQVGQKLGESHLDYLKEVELMQYTGLKDKNGKEIYEGDIVQIQHPCWCENMIVKFDYGMFFCEQIHKHPKNECKACPDFRDIKRTEIWKIEIIGNIYENPELLEGK